MSDEPQPPIPPHLQARVDAAQATGWAERLLIAAPLVVVPPGRSFRDRLVASEPQDVRIAIGAAALVTAERERQIAEEGYTAANDAEYPPGALGRAGVCYIDRALHELAGVVAPGHKARPEGWPFQDGAWKPRDAMSNLVRGVALVLAEIDRTVDIASDPAEIGRTLPPATLQVLADIYTAVRLTGASVITAVVAVGSATLLREKELIVTDPTGRYAITELGQRVVEASTR